MEKILEVVAKAIWVANIYPARGEQPDESSMNDYRRMAKSAIAAVRAHDAGTDEEVISYRARQIWRRFVEIPITKPYATEFQWLLDLLSGNEAPKKTLTEAVQEARGNLEPPTVPIRFASPASHAAESAPQLDAEDPAEPVEDVPPGYVKLEDVEKAIREMLPHWEAPAIDAFMDTLHKTLAPKPSLGRFTGFDITYREADMHAFKPRVCGLCGSWVIDDLAHTGWHNNLQLGKQIAALVREEGRKVMWIYCVPCTTEVEARLVSGKEIYPHRPDLFSLPFWKCDTCGGYVGCHHKTADRTRPLGCIPGRELMELRKKIHALIDPIWRGKRMKRGAVYAKLGDALGREYHTGELRSVREANLVLQAATELVDRRTK